MKRTPLLLLAALTSLSCLVLAITASSAALSAESGASEARTAQTDLQRLEGRWIRPDGGYMLVLSDIRKDGSLKASYFNPRPINVLQAKWTRKDRTLNLYVELRDVNYPGSKYNLRYAPKDDRLRGTYFQAVEQQTYEVEFVRSQ